MNSVPSRPDLGCPLCGGVLRMPASQAYQGNCLIDCKNCGRHRITPTASVSVGPLAADDMARARMGYWASRLNEHTVITHQLLEQVAAIKLPSAGDRLDNLVLYLAKHFEPGERSDLHATHMRATIGTVTAESVYWTMMQALKTGLIEVEEKPAGVATTPMLGVCLTVQGWQRYDELMRNGAGSQHAFMAMKFGDAELDGVFRDHLREAVRQTGFELRTVAGDHKTAGSIDDRMRVEIRTSRFLVCDLSHGNRGAYWEAGFAEGLGRPVFYVCRRDVLADRNHPDHPHFDTAHQLISSWSLDTIASDMQDLKQTIRNTLPAEAKMQDG